MGLILSLFNGCTRTVYVKTPCPKLQTVEIGEDIKPLKIEYKVVSDDTVE